MDIFQRHQSTKPKKQFKESSSVTFDHFTNEIEAEVLRHVVHNCIKQLTKSPDDETLDAVRQQLSKYQVIVIRHNQGEHWLTKPMSLHTEIFDGTRKIQRVEYQSITLNTSTIRTSTSNATLFGVAMEDLRQFLNQAIDTRERLGIFKNPYAAMNMTRLHRDITDYESYHNEFDTGLWPVKKTLHTQNLTELLEKTITYTDTQKPSPISR